ncbi:ribonuclease P protein component [Kaistella montana]|uniref:Ribonuclease P protein component n=1 Tax=Kaistella montana TaxID=1849733 RepID=A0ABW5K9Q6_9FLAO|nr:ribonuclease P protein component [Kaistella montana]MCQ4035715.1 ribonuclease P protein component [Kaistella montana]
MNQKYPTKEKLKQKKEIDLLFGKGKWLTCGNLRLISINLDKKPQEGLVVENQKIGVSVSKRYFKTAVHRNRIKRQLREVYRLNKSVFTEVFGTHSLTMIFWVSPELPKDFKSLEENFINLCKSKK